MKEIIQMYERAFADHGPSEKAVFWPKGRQDERFFALTKSIHRDNFSILDFGCGIGHLHNFLKMKFGQVDYMGVDIVPSFIEHCRREFRESRFQLVKSPKDIEQNFDYVMLSGVFNILYSENKEEHLEIVKATITELFSKTKIALSVNFMTDNVDFQQTGAYHQNPAEIFNFFQQSLSRRCLLDQSYMPYEYTITAWKDDRIQRPDNTFSAP